MVLFPSPPFFFFIHPQEPTAGLGFRFRIESAAVPGPATHRPAATASWPGFSLWTQ